MKELKSCPFCGSAPMINRKQGMDGEVYSVDCVNGKCMLICETHFEDTERQAVEIWNTRAPQEGK